MIPLVSSISGPVLLPHERDLLASIPPFGVMLFQRNCEHPQQVRELVQAIRSANPKQPASIWIDQEGGAVARLTPPNWPVFPAASEFGKKYRQHRESAITACYLNAHRIGGCLRSLGIDVNCAPVLDIFHSVGDPIIGTRAFSDCPNAVVELGAAAVRGYKEAGVTPVIKHLPGHGRAECDSHISMPRITTSRKLLEQTDFAPFRALAKDVTMAMVGHMAITEIDGEMPATCSGKIISEIVRQHCGFSGLIVSDALEMEALSGDVITRALRCLEAGCDLVIYGQGCENVVAPLATALQEHLSPDN